MSNSQNQAPSKAPAAKVKPKPQIVEAPAAPAKKVAVEDVQAEQPRGTNENVTPVDESGFTPQGTGRVAEEALEVLSDDNFGTESPETVVDVLQEDEPPVEVEDLVAPELGVQIVSEDALEPQEEPIPDVHEAVPPIVAPHTMDDPAVLERDIEDALNPEAMQESFDEDSVDEDEYDPSADEIDDDLADEVLQSTSLGQVGGSAMVADSYHNSNRDVVDVVLSLATLGIMVKELDGVVDNLNQLNTQPYGAIMRYSSIPMIAKIPRGGFGNMTGAVYIKSLTQMFAKFQNLENLEVSTYICPGDKGFDVRENLLEAIADGSVMTLQDAIERKEKISNHHFLVILTAKNSVNGLLSLRASCDPTTENFLYLQNTVEAITPSLLGVSRFVAELASTGHYALGTSESDYSDRLYRSHDYSLDAPNYWGGDVEGGRKEIVETYTISMLELERPISDAISPLLSPSRLRELVNNIEGQTLDRFSTVGVTLDHKVSQWTQGITEYKLKLSLAQANEIDLSSFEFPEEDEDELEEDE